VKLHAVLIFALVVLFVAFEQAEAQTTECRICTTRSFYEQGDTVVITGKVDVVLEKTPIIIQVFNPLQNLVEVAQVDVSQDGSFTHRIVADGSYFRTSGKYTIKATYGISTNVYESNFEFQTKDTTGATNIFDVRIPGSSGTFDVPYSIRGGTVTNMFIDPDMFSLIVQINATGDGSLVLDLERGLIDARRGTDGRSGNDDSYIIQIDGIQVPYQETSTNPEFRRITVQFERGASDIEIIGTWVVPEFGAIAAMILVVGTTAAIIYAKRLPRF
jgi:archaellum component FlaF (FlaF/FlaG flagellin family)